MISKFSKETRATKIHSNEELFKKDLGRVHARFIGEACVGMHESGSVRLTEIGRALKEDIALHATRKRLSRNLADEKIQSVVGDRVLELGSKKINEDTLLVVNTSGLKKKYAVSMEYLDVVRDGYDRTASKGYSFCEVVGWDIWRSTKPAP